MINISQLNTQQADFWQQLDQVLSWESVSDEQVFNTVNGIIRDIRARGDAAVVEYTNKFDRVNVSSMAELEIPRARLQESLGKISPEQRTALEKAAERVRAYAEHQKMESWSYTEDDGTF